MDAGGWRAIGIMMVAACTVEEGHDAVVVHMVVEMNCWINYMSPTGGWN